MKITLSKSQWQKIGRKAGWIRKSQDNTKKISDIIEKINAWVGFMEDPNMTSSIYIENLEERLPRMGVNWYNLLSGNIGSRANAIVQNLKALQEINDPGIQNTIGNEIGPLISNSGLGYLAQIESVLQSGEMRSKVGTIDPEFLKIVRYVASILPNVIRDVKQLMQKLSSVIQN